MHSSPDFNPAPDDGEAKLNPFCSSVWKMMTETLSSPGIAHAIQCCGRVQDSN